MSDIQFITQKDIIDGRTEETLCEKDGGVENLESKPKWRKCPVIEGRYVFNSHNIFKEPTAELMATHYGYSVRVRYPKWVQNRIIDKFFNNSQEAIDFSESILFY